jgi:hypothetical protein
MTKLRDCLVVKLTLEFKGKLLGMVFDGWSDGSGNHYVALFIVYEGIESNCIARLISVAPLLDETSFDANSHREYFEQTLHYYGLDLSRIKFIVCDNCSVNISLCEKLKIPMIGCASHRFNLGMKEFYSKYENDLSDANKIMKKLSNLKNSGVLRTMTPLRPIIRNTTRWSSTNAMLNRFLKFYDEGIINSKEFNNIDTKNGLLKNRQVMRELMELRPKLSKKKIIISFYHLNLFFLDNFDLVTKELQKSDINMLMVRVVFDSVVQAFPQVARKLGPDADIVHFKNFENGIVKIMFSQLREEYDPGLTASEELEMAPFFQSRSITSIPDSDDIVDVCDFVKQAQLEIKKKAKTASSKYINLKWIPPTSNMVERLFSRMKIVFADRRKSMYPQTMETIMMLTCNRDAWNVNDVNKIYLNRQSCKLNVVDEEEESEKDDNDCDPDDEDYTED